MKISYMLRREDFYTVNEQTLKKFFRKEKGNATTLYIYPHLNAIITRIPSAKVKEYIYTEYSVNASLPKKLAVWAYTRLCMNSFGLLATKKLKIPCAVSSQTLIYPCNRKFRIFDFEKNLVSVITKTGFSTNSIRNEITFRKGCKPNDFILPVHTFAEDEYSERIIDGIPLARVSENRDSLAENALGMWREYSKDNEKTLLPSQYSDILENKIASLTERLSGLKPCVNFQKLHAVVKRFVDRMKASDENITVSMSHGDLQPGNIWIENETKKIYIIDWETVDERSIWYDSAVLYDQIRKPHHFEAFAKINDLRHTVVVIEEILYRMNELCELPEDYGTDDFNLFISGLEKQ